MRRQSVKQRLRRCKQEIEDVRQTMGTLTPSERNWQSQRVTGRMTVPIRGLTGAPPTYQILYARQCLRRRPVW